MLTIGLKQLTPWWSPYSPRDTWSLYFALTSDPIARATFSIKRQLKLHTKLADELR